MNVRPFGGDGMSYRHAIRGRIVLPAVDSPHAVLVAELLA